MSVASDKMKSVFRSVLESVAESLQESVGRDDALRTLRIDTKNDNYELVIGKLAAAIVELQNEVAELQKKAEKE